MTKLNGLLMERGGVIGIYWGRIVLQNCKTHQIHIEIIGFN